MSTSTSLTLRSLLKSAVARAALDRPAAVTAGLSPAAKALCTAAVAQANPHGPVVVVVATDADVEQMVSDARFFFGALEGFSDVALERAILPFPSQQVDPYRGMQPHFRVSSARARALHALTGGLARIVVTSAAGLLPRVSPPARLQAASIELKPGMDIRPTDLADLLADAGFTREDPVDEHGEFCVRGGIVDIYPAGEDEPVRIEFIGDTIESLRRYDPATQRSTQPIDQLSIVPLHEQFGQDPSAPVGRSGPDEPQPSSGGLKPSRYDSTEGATDVAGGLQASRSATLFDYLSLHGAPRLLVSEWDEVEANATKLQDQITASHDDAVARGEQAPPPGHLIVGWDEAARKLSHAMRLEQLALGETGPAEALGAKAEAGAHDATTAHRPPPTAGTRHVSCQVAQEYRGRVGDWVVEIRRARERGEVVLFVADTQGRAERIVEVLHDYEVVAVPVENTDGVHAASVLVARGQLTRGFRLPDAAIDIFSETDIFEEERRITERTRSAAKTFLSDLRDLKVGDLVVHVDHGIGEFVGLKQLGIGGGGTAQEFLELRYHGDDKLFVPVERLDLIQKYTGGTRPALDRLGGTTWEKAKTRVKKAMRDMAEELLKLYAQRKAVPGHAFPPDTHWQEEFEDAFPYDLTVDQANAITDIKRDMEAPTPMDRLLCGDVGYGKTEVAMRAAFKAVMDGKQVAFLAPTTVLASQHLKTLRERFAGFPVKIDMISRFRTKQEIAQALEDLAAGRLDIIVGTHRLLTKDVVFRDLGLLVVDEEQRFGVAHKERIKQMRKRVDVLTMTATPIPRTLNMSLVGIRDMSIIETPPKDRLSIQTNVLKFDAAVIGRAIRNELARGGQVFVVHNRVESIFSIGNLIQKLVPEAKIVIGHGQMGDDELERAMLDFMSRKYDVLLATTIVENGLDIPNANTIIINRADRYGLAQLYQLRGRVGRSDRPAYAYLMIPPEESLSAVARKRLAAMKEFSDLGSGFRVAALDLEIRGAGNLLGGEQSGQIEAVGFEMYMKLLEETIRELKGEDLEDDLRATVNLRVDLKIDEQYIADMNQRLMVYRKIASSRTEPELDRVLDEIRDRYGPLPVSVLNLAEYGRIRILADRLGVDTIDREAGLVVIKFRPHARVDPEHLVKLVQQRGDLVLVPPNGVKLDLRAPLKRTAPAAPKPAVGGGRWAVDPRSGRASALPASAPPASKPGMFGPRYPAPAYPGGASRGPQGPGPERRASVGPIAGVRDTSAESWWTRRATAGEVTPGFTKGELTRRPEEDPRAEGGMFDRLGSLLRALAK